MSRRLFCLALLLLASAAVAAARPRKSTLRFADLPAWVREAAARPVPSSDADLVWLHDEKIVEPVQAGGVRVARRVAAKITKPSGLNALESWTLSYRRGDEIVTLKSWTLQTDGTARASDPKDDVSDVPAISSFSVFEDARARVIRTPAAMVGSVVAFEDELIESIDVGAALFRFGDANRTTVFSRFALRVPEKWGREAVPLRAEGLAKEETSAGFVWTAQEIPPLPREELRPPAEELQPTVWARWWSPDGGRGYRDWDAVGRWYQDLTAGTLADKGEAAEIAARLKPSASDRLLDSLARAYAFAARDVRYVSIQVGIGGFKPHSPAEVAANRYGDCKDKSFLLRALAAGWGVKTYPVLARVRKDGRVEPTVPSPGQFDHCIAAVALPEGTGGDLWPVLDVPGIGRLLILDATVREGSPWNLPKSVQGTFGLLVHPEGGKLIQLPVQPPEAGSTRRSLTAKVDEEGKLLEATLIETFGGSDALQVRDYYAGKTTEQMRRNVLQDLQDRFAGAAIADYHIDGIDHVEGPVVETTKLSGGRLGKRVGDLLILEPGRGGYGVIGRWLPAPPRKWPLDLGAPREEILEISIEVPTGWKEEDGPAPMKVESSDLVAGSEWKAEGATLAYKRTARLLAAEIPTDRYARFRESLQRVQAEDARAVVFVKR